jgi:hypothetical protein
MALRLIGSGFPSQPFPPTMAGELSQPIGSVIPTHLLLLNTYLLTCVYFQCPVPMLSSDRLLHILCAFKIQDVEWSGAERLYNEQRAIVVPPSLPLLNG